VDKFGQLINAIGINDKMKLIKNARDSSLGRFLFDLNWLPNEPASV